MFAGRIKLKTFVAGAAVLGVVGAGGAYVAMDNAAPPEAPVTALDPHESDPHDHATPPSPDPLVAPRPNRVNLPPVSPRPVAVSPNPVSPNPASPTPASPSPQPVAVDGPSERAVDRSVMSWVGRDLGSKKKKDVTTGQPFKINVYQDPGNTTANRAKVDLDRDDKWDEKWTFKPGEISRKVSSNDDDNYDKEQLWKNGAWATR